MKARWVVDSTTIEMFDDVKRAIETLDNTADVFYVKHDDKEIKINKRDVSIEIDE